jgi:hypothetical protein
MRPGHQPSLGRFLRAIPRLDLQAGDQHDIDHFVISIGQVHMHFPPGRRDGHDILVLHGDAPAVGHANKEGTERLGVEQFSDFVDFHRERTLRPCRKKARLDGSDAATQQPHGEACTLMSGGGIVIISQ